MDLVGWRLARRLCCCYASFGVETSSRSSRSSGSTGARRNIQLGASLGAQFCFRGGGDFRRRAIREIGNLRQNGRSAETASRRSFRRGATAAVLQFRTWSQGRVPNRLTFPRPGNCRPPPPRSWRRLAQGAEGNRNNAATEASTSTKRGSSPGRCAIAMAPIGSSAKM
jgi:hypothetical protein